ncbi:carotenoid oxygenase family protein [Kutzneria sp. CA-103260]|uniref:carotenoid oxygenase family protein n=1 Tax=Kutzneria sp. CA-103260 TaxID=2802641 RepID=UPI001BA69899|nr:carotenoid oxygenase family protein [Kutzneria sp. CA-103260]QUQ68325.1 retinal pigment epithelial membrane protein [Kutzneria sp. CA-103260]
MSDNTPIYLQGTLAPVPDETDAVNLPIEGALPEELSGRYFRNGPNPKPGEDPGHWFTGHGMLHGVRLRDGRAEWYRNRWVRTRTLEGARPFREDGTRDLAVGSANTSVIEHGGKIFALVETSFPHQVTPELDTVGPCDFGGRLTTGMTAHPKEDPVTGELHLFGYGFKPPFLTYHRLSADGQLITSFPVEVGGPTMMHDFAITENHLVWLDLPAVFNPARVGKGMPYEWSDSYRPRIGVMHKDGGPVQWFDVDPCYVFHVGNAREDGQGRITLDAVRYNRAAFLTTWSDMYSSPDSNGSAIVSSAVLHRWTLDTTTGRVSEQQLDDQHIEFPTVDDRLVGRSNRYLYAVDQHAIVKYDNASGAVHRHELGTDWHTGEAVFVPAAGGTAEDDGWLMSIVTNIDPTVPSRLLVHDATDVTAKPVAAVQLPRRVPAGFHGSWIPDSELA